jgi:hypothetical protein
MNAHDTSVVSSSRRHSPGKKKAALDEIKGAEQGHAKWRLTCLLF